VSRTRGPQIRNLSLYPTELQGQPDVALKMVGFNMHFYACQSSYGGQIT
jgi:hypothetical protein